LITVEREDLIYDYIGGIFRGLGGVSIGSAARAAVSIDA